MLALGARVLADGVGFGRLVGGRTVYGMSRVHRYGRRCRGAWQDWCEPVLSCNGKNDNGAGNIVGRFTNRPYGCIWHGPPVWMDAL